MRKCDDDLAIMPFRKEALASIKPRGSGPPPALAIALAIIASFGGGLLMHYKAQPKEQATFTIPTTTTWFPEGGMRYSEIAKPVPITDLGMRQALFEAVKEWRGALGRRVKEPALLLDSPAGANCMGDFGGGIIACADVDKYTIFVRSIYYADAKTIMLHELGHLLGVPHIQGDPLMDSVYQGKRDGGPSLDAVAIAEARFRLCENQPARGN